MNWSCRVQRINFHCKLLPLRMVSFQALGRGIGLFDEAEVRRGLANRQYDAYSRKLICIAYIVEGSGVG